MSLPKIDALARAYLSRRTLAALAIAYTAFVIYGSLVPLDFHPLDLPTAVQRFREIPFLQIDAYHRADWAANVMLFIPLAFLWTGVVVNQRRDAGAMLAALCVVALCVVLSLGVEFTQLWFPQRTTSWNDILAECIGGVVGACLWFLVGRSFSEWACSWSPAATRANRIDKLLAAYCFCLAVFAILPVDLTISLTEIYEKYKVGRINFVPFAKNRPLTILTAYELLRDIVIFLPVGALAYRCLIHLEEPRRFRRSILLGIAAVAAIECAQVVVFSRYADVTDLFTCSAGVIGGAMIAKRLDGRQAVSQFGRVKSTARASRAWIPLCVLLVYAAVLCGTAWYPFEFNFDQEFIKERLKAFIAAPMTTLYWNSEMGALTSALKHTIWFIPVGILIERITRIHVRNRDVGTALLVFFMLATLPLGAVLELGQLAIPARTPSFDGIWLRVLGALIGVCGSRWLAAGESRRADSEVAGEAFWASPPAAAPAASGHIAGLDGLRALAAGTVFLANLRHLVAFEPHRAGPLELRRFAASGVGVCLFFVLSGFLLTRSYWRSSHEWDAWRQPSKYLAHRLLRIGPAYLVCLIGLVIITRHWRTSLDAMDTALHLSLLHNLTEFSFYSINDPFWTIAVQMQFYLLLPLLMLAAHRLGRRPAGVFAALLALSAVCYAAHFLVMWSASRVHPWPFDREWLQPDGFVLTKSTLAHLPIFLIGCALGYLASSSFLHRSARGAHRLKRMAAFWIAIAVVAAMTATRCEDLLNPPHSRYSYPILPIALAATVLFVQDSGIVRVLEFAPLRFIGMLSYGIFIYHFPCLKAVAKFAEVAGTPWLGSAWGLSSAGFALTLVLATASYYLLEEPLVRRLTWRRRVAGSPIAAPHGA